MTKILALLAAFVLGALSKFWLYPKAFAYTLQYVPSMRKKMRDALDALDKDD